MSISLEELNKKMDDSQVNLSTTTATSTVTVNSSDGDNALIPAATTTKAGVLSKDKFNEIKANTTKIGITSAQASAITSNSSKTGITATQAANIITNNSKVSDINHNTWRGIDDTPVNGQTNESISSNWAHGHQNKVGVSYGHLPTLIPDGTWSGTWGATGKYLRGNGEWDYPPDTRNIIDQEPALANSTHSISSKWAYNHSNSVHIPDGGTKSDYFRGDNTWAPLFPIGTIIMFDANHTIGATGKSGAWVDNETMPGWYACIPENDSKNCPNMVNRFVMGKIVAGVMVSGGANAKSLAVTNMPSHRHYATHDHGATTSGNPSANHTHAQSSASSHVVTAVVNSAGGTDLYEHWSVANGLWADHSSVIDWPAQSTGTVSAWHTHATDLANIGHYSDYQGSGSSFDNRPAYYTVVFIRKCS